MPKQSAVMCKSCPLGSAEAEELYQRGRAYQEGHGSYPVDIPKAFHLFADAHKLGNSKAPIAMGQLVMYTPPEGLKGDHSCPK